MLVSRGEAPGEHALLLILAQLVVAVWRLQPIARRKQVEVEDILTGGLIIKAVEDRFIISLVVERRKLRGVQKPPAAKAIKGNKIPHFLIAESQGDAAADGPERPVG